MITSIYLFPSIMLQSRIHGIRCNLIVKAMLGKEETFKAQTGYL